MTYIDWTVQPSRRDGLGQLLGIAAITFPDDEVRRFERNALDIRHDFGVPDEIELKWSEDHRHDWFRRCGRTDAISPLRRAVLDEVGRRHGVAHVVVWDTSAAPHLEGRDAFDCAFDFLYERVCIFLRRRGELGLMFTDRPGGGPKAEAAWSAARAPLIEEGTEYIEGGTIVSKIVPVESKEHAQIQVADLIAGAVTAAIGGGRYGLELLPAIRPLLDTNRAGLIGSAGLKLWPDPLNNLHLLLLGEHELRRHAGPVQLPNPDWLFPAVRDHVTAA